MKTTLYFTLTLFAFVTLAFVPNSFAQGADYIVQVIYFHPNDIEPQEDSVNTLKTMMKDIQTFYADEMERHGYGRKTFRLETNAAGDVVVHYLQGKFNSLHYSVKDNDVYHVNSEKVRPEINQHLDQGKRIIYLVWIDFHDPRTKVGNLVGGYGEGAWPFGGTAWIYPTNFDSTIESAYLRAWFVMAHELGHIFGLVHDFRKAAYIMSYGPGRNELSSCAAEWLDVNPYFNLGATAADTPARVEMLPPLLVSPPNMVRLRFEINDDDGIHQVQLYADAFLGKHSVIACKGLAGSRSSTVEFIAPLTQETEYVYLKVIDVHGNYENFSGFKFPIDITTLLPNPTPISIPGPDLAAAIRKTFNLNPNVPITQLDMVSLTRLDAVNFQITDLTGIEHAISISSLNLAANRINDLTPLAKLTNLDWLRLDENQISDITPLAGLTNLSHLYLNGNQISDITPLAGLTNLSHLYLNGNQISDITPLAGLTNLSHLYLDRNQISDITPLAGLTNLSHLYLNGNQISDITPLAGLTNLDKLRLTGNQIKDITPLGALKRLRILYLMNNQISDITPLLGLTQLGGLFLDGNQISDVSPLAGLINVGTLRLQGNPIKNRKPLLELLRKNPDVEIYITDKNGREKLLPVTLSHFQAERTNAGIILKWTTESEVDNAGFYIYRSETKDGEFKVINPAIIQGAGTTGERNEYTWTDTTAKSNTVYYYQIEDVSHAGVREQLATVRLRGLISAKGKLTTRWADLKAER